MALFDAYVMVDWSAAAAPRQGADSIWVASLERRGGRLGECRLDNPPTRSAAAGLLADLLSDLVARGRTVLVGCDFNFGFPQGFAAALDPAKPDWQRVWARLAAEVHDSPDNANDRFAVAARLNAALSGGPFPFWGCPTERSGDCLLPRKPAPPAAFSAAEFRLCEARAKGVQPVWKLFGAGSVGSQTLLGIPRLEALRRHPWLAGQVRVWPFETGLKPMDRPPAGTIVLAEIYPSLVPAAPAPVRDAGQVQAVTSHFAGLDDSGRLGPLFAGDPSLSQAERAVVEREEGWILGVSRPTDRSVGQRTFDYLRKPGAIYERSFAIIRSETDLGRFPGLMEQVALRVIHACGMPEIADDLAFTPGAAEAGRAALLAGKPILVDARMVAHGIIRGRLPADNVVACGLDETQAPGLAKTMGTTVSAAGAALWADRLEGAVVAIGNAPTALYQLLEMVAAGAAPPAVILGFPVGFVGAAESKEALIASGLPHICLRGRRGGSAMAAAAVNALAGDSA